jgi:hypothetical protein
LPIIQKASGSLLATIAKTVPLIHLAGKLAVIDGVVITHTSEVRQTWFFELVVIMITRALKFTLGHFQ